jgi:DNA-binding FadR family transcriptional regulator
LRQQVEGQIREAIVQRSLGEGDKLPSEAELARMFSVSRSTVREALRSLDAIGLIEKVPGASGGSFVKMIDSETFGRAIGNSMEMLIELGNADLEEVSFVRRLLEVPCCRIAATQRTAEDVERLYDIVDRQRKASVEDPSVPGMDIEFHAGVAQATGNRVLSALVFGLHSVTRPVEHMAISEEAGKRTVRQHLAVVKAIEAKEPNAAESAINEHLDYIQNLGSH